MQHRYSPKDIVSSGMCIGCGICVAQSAGTSMKFDAFGQLKPQGPSHWFRNPSESFSNTCPFSPEAKNEDDISAALFPALSRHPSIGHYKTNYVGHVSEDDFRMQGSSGGMVTWVATELMRKGLIDGVAHVVATETPQTEERFFKYRISRIVQEVREGAKSRYYPVELSEILRTIKDIPGRYAIVVIPCMVKAINLLRRNDPVYRERIRFTLGLFCGHMKSTRFVESMAWQMKIPVDQIKKVEFRNKYPERPANWYNTKLTLHNGREYTKDWWHLKDGDWGAGFFMNSACNFCDDVVAETADVSFGDAWIEPYASDGKGNNVIVVRSSEIDEIITAGIMENRLKLEEVNAEFVGQTQAAGLRQRREGLVYRLTLLKPAVTPVKRITPNGDKPSEGRKRIYRMRYLISKWSHKIFWLASTLNFAGIYIFWARLVAALYYGIAYYKGNYRQIKKRFTELGQS